MSFQIRLQAKASPTNIALEWPLFVVHNTNVFVSGITWSIFEGHNQGATEHMVSNWRLLVGLLKPWKSLQKSSRERIQLWDAC